MFLIAAVLAFHWFIFLSLAWLFFYWLQYVLYVFVCECDILNQSTRKKPRVRPQ